MNKEEIIDSYKVLECFEPDDLSECAIYRKHMKRIENLIELYNKQKERLKLLQDAYDKRVFEIIKIEDFKEKVKEILSIEDDMEEDRILSLLQTIVDENNRLENIEDEKIQIEYENVFNKGFKKGQEKIKELQEENETLKKQIMYMKSIDNKDILKYWRKK